MDILSLPVVAGRRWTGQMWEPNADVRPVLWGFGFDPRRQPVAALGIVLAPEAVGTIVRLRVWHRPDERVTSPFEPPHENEVPLLKRSYKIPDAQARDAIRQFHWLELSGLPPREGLHICAITLTDGDEPRPLAVGISSWERPWDWQAGWFMLEGKQPRPAKFPHGLAWLLRGPADIDRKAWSPSSWVRGDGEMGAAEGAFTVVTPQLKVETIAGVVAIHEQRVEVPAPASENCRYQLAAGEKTAQLPFRHVEIEEAPPAVKFRASDSLLLRHQGGSEPALVRYRGWKSRYDLLSLNTRTGGVHLNLGDERALDPEEFPAGVPPGHLPLYSLYTTFEGVEPIFVGDWCGLVRIGDEGRHLRWLEHCRQRLGKTLRKLRSGQDLRLVGYGDSITALGSRHPDLLDGPNGDHRDNMGYFERYGADWKRKQRCSSDDRVSGDVPHHRLGWNWHLKRAIEDRWPVKVEYLNWGLPGTTSDAAAVPIEGSSYPGAANPSRLAKMLQDNADLVTVAVGMNDVGEPIDTRGNIVTICETIRARGADVIVIGPCRQNPDWRSRDPMLWQQTYEDVLAGAKEADVAYVPTWELFGDGYQGALGLSARSYSAASMGNHPGARELAAVGALLASIIP